MTLRALRQKKGMSLSEAARSIHYDVSNLSKIERGLQDLTLKTASKLSKLYGVSLDTIVGASNQSKSQKKRTVN